MTVKTETICKRTGQDRAGYLGGPHDTALGLTVDSDFQQISWFMTSSLTQERDSSQGTSWPFIGRTSSNNNTVQAVAVCERSSAQVCCSTQASASITWVSRCNKQTVVIQLYMSITQAAINSLCLLANNAVEIITKQAQLTVDRCQY